MRDTVENLTKMLDALVLNNLRRYYAKRVVDIHWRKHRIPHETYLLTMV